MANEALRFVLELAALAVFGLFGYALADSGWRYVLMIAVPLVGATLWGAFAAPRSTRRLPDPWRFAFEACFFGAAAGVLVWLGWAAAGAAFAVVALVNMTLVRVLRGPSFDPSTHSGPSSG